MSAIIRPYVPEDARAVLAVNEASLPAVNSIDTSELDDLARQSVATLVAVEKDTLLGVLICLDQTARYDSRNFAWLKENLGEFLYVDRIALAPEARGRALGQALYGHLIDLFARNSEYAGLPLACEVNTRPANPGSLRFHARLGFREIGTADHGDKAVVYLARPLAGTPAQGS
ncbi:MAG: GNAT family N-acetyltransferase [Stappia sp.]|uniref:GNAT family N-acetyltransferase n=1 Tax=Stappia sp. TaxID=1870903 RepID=UPI000C5112E9|nr:GNAT family N-acetyltransferase [Stappia sp.]MAB00573.1 GNAT family N-acetyltransferase [Stappia sp.]MBM18643.1 GNAT family N-acetyltransferase [Stappia sp.]